MSAVLAHFVGDYLIQSHWMASEKVEGWFPAACHALTYTLVFLFITTSPLALAIICLSHFAIDHWRLARFVVYAKNFLAPKKYWPSKLTPTGYDESVPAWMATWLLIITDNIIHIVINLIAIKYLG